MDSLYDYAGKNISRTWLLLMVFVGLICGLGYVLARYYDEPWILYTAMVFSLIQVWSSYWFSKSIILGSVHAHKATEADNPYINNLVENLAMSIGLPTPELYVIDDPAPNAFATGRNPKDAVICITTGLINLLSYDVDGKPDLKSKRKLEGVLAHELSHIKNYDILLSSIVVTLVGIISIMVNLFARSGSNRSRSRNDNDSSGSILAILGLIGIILAPLAATLLQFAISRKREYLADANAGIITRFPEGLAEALEDIAQDGHKLNVPTNVQSLFIASPLKNDVSSQGSWLTKLFDTHPPLEERIKLLRAIDHQI